MIITRTPFRISFFGGGTDYPAWYHEHGGAVLSTTIDKYCYISCRYLPPFFEHRSRIVWSQVESVSHHGEIQHPSVRACLQHFGITDGVEIHHDADLPARSGLGSSSAFTVGLVGALHGLLGKMVGKRDLAATAVHLEQNVMRENVGTQDQVACAHGGMNLITFSKEHTFTVQPAIVRSDIRASLEQRLLLVFTGLSRNASEVAGEQIGHIPKKQQELHTMRHMVDIAYGYLQEGNLDAFGALLHESWQLKRSLSPRVTTSRVDDVYAAARRGGALGGKLLGAGAGGFMLFYVRPEDRDRVRAELQGLLEVPFAFEHAGSHVAFYSPELRSDHLPVVTAAPVASALSS